MAKVRLRATTQVRRRKDFRSSGKHGTNSCHRMPPARTPILRQQSPRRRHPRRSHRPSSSQRQPSRVDRSPTLRSCRLLPSKRSPIPRKAHQQRQRILGRLAKQSLRMRSQTTSAPQAYSSPEYLAREGIASPAAGDDVAIRTPGEVVLASPCPRRGRRDSYRAGRGSTPAPSPSFLEVIAARNLSLPRAPVSIPFIAPQTPAQQR